MANASAHTLISMPRWRISSRTLLRVLRRSLAPALLLLAMPGCIASNSATTRVRVLRRSLAPALLLLAMPGCIASNSATTRATSGASSQPAPFSPDADQADEDPVRPAYWFNQPAEVTVRCPDYQRLISECQHSARQRLFEIDRVDYREGIVATRPLISKQFWEFWRSDVVDCHNLMAASLATYRRTLRWEIHQADLGGYTASPKVVIERFTAPPRRITAASSYRSSLSQAETQTSLTGDNLKTLGEGNWYATGRDKHLEDSLAKAMRERLK